MRFAIAPILEGRPLLLIPPHVLVLTTNIPLYLARPFCVTAILYNINIKKSIKSELNTTVDKY
jgi:hypothetical protein